MLGVTREQVVSKLARTRTCHKNRTKQGKNVVVMDQRERNRSQGG